LDLQKVKRKENEVKLRRREGNEIRARRMAEGKSVKRKEILHPLRSGSPLGLDTDTMDGRRDSRLTRQTVNFSIRSNRLE
jgi:hypothetical protein